MILTVNTTIEMVLIHLGQHGFRPSSVHKSASPSLEDDAVFFVNGVHMSIGRGTALVLKREGQVYRTLYSGNVMKAAMSAIRKETQA